MDKPILGEELVNAQVGATTVCRILGLSHQRVQDLAKAGWIKRIGIGIYPLAGAVQGYITFLKAEERRTSKVATASRVQAARARAIELKTAREEHELMEVEEGIAFVDEMIGFLKNELNGLAAAYTRDIPERRKIQELVDAVFSRAAVVFAERASALEKGGEIVPADPEDEPG